MTPPHVTRDQLRMARVARLQATLVRALYADAEPFAAQPCLAPDESAPGNPAGITARFARNPEPSLQESPSGP